MVLYVRHVPKHIEDKKKSWFEGRFDETLFKGKIVGYALKVPHRIEKGRLMSI